MSSSGVQLLLCCLALAVCTAESSSWYSGIFPSAPAKKSKVFARSSHEVNDQQIQNIDFLDLQDVVAGKPATAQKQKHHAAKKAHHALNHNLERQSQPAATKNTKDKMVHHSSTTEFVEEFEKDSKQQQPKAQMKTHEAKTASKTVTSPKAGQASHFHSDSKQKQVPLKHQQLEQTKTGEASTAKKTTTVSAPQDASHTKAKQSHAAPKHPQRVREMKVVPAPRPHGTPTGSLERERMVRQYVNAQGLRVVAKIV